jgi:3-hydroxyacyl-[acyl-carrier-protein] dehydratase
MSAEPPTYPFVLDRAAIEDLLPHRGDIFVCQQVTVEASNHFRGIACWPAANAIIEGHFPGLPLVPGVFLIEAAAQLAGAGLLAGDPYVQTLTGDLVGVLAAVRKTVFKRPVLPDRDVEFLIRCRQMAPMAVQVTASVQVDGREAAELDILMAYTPRPELIAALSGNL